MSGRTVKIFLVDGIPNGLITAEIMNWTGKFTVVPRSQLVDLAKRDEVKRTGVYFLTGSYTKDPTQEMVYIGESDNIWNRLAQHNKDSDKDFWEKTVIVTSKDENLTKAHVRYLESRLIRVTSEAKRALLANGTNPDTTTLPEPDVADMEYFLEQIQMILPVLGFTFANPLPKVTTSPQGKADKVTSPVFCFTYAGTNAKAQEINGEFVILQGSSARKKHTDSLASSYKDIRNKLVKDGSLVDSSSPEFWIFTQNVPFQSPSTAANIVGGASLNGRLHWKVEGTMTSYADWQNQQVDMAGKTVTGENN
jgi:hypothetical protein